MAEAWKQLSGGRVQVDIFPGGVMGNEPHMVQKMRFGQIQGAALSGQEGLSQIAAELRVFETPMLLRSNAELDYVRYRVRQQLEALLADRGFKVLDWSDVGWVYLFTNKPVVYPADAKKLRIRVSTSDAAWEKALKKGGYHPVPLPVTEMHTGLQSGLIDGFTTPPVMALATQWFGIANHMTAMKWAPLTGALIVSQSAWDEIPEEIRPLLLAAARKACGQAQGEIRRFEDDAIEAMQKYGLTVHEVPPAVARKWEIEVRSTYPSIIGASIPKHIYNTVAKHLQQYRSHGGGE
tara:strand:+ start:1417 stop:2295 length:879 start_codon:yes stop_codon:yes gene_type:complete